VQRRDDWVRLLQTLLLSVLWVHPAALLVSRGLNREREMACDEWVVARTGSPKAFARCLARAAEVRGRMKASIRARARALRDAARTGGRVDRLLKLKGQARRNVSFAGAIAAALALVVSSVHLQGLRFRGDRRRHDSERRPANPGGVRRSHDSPHGIARRRGAAVERGPPTNGYSNHAPLHRACTRRVRCILQTRCIVRTHCTDRTLCTYRTDCPCRITVAPSVSFTASIQCQTRLSHRLSMRHSMERPGHTGVEIASAAKKTSVGVANVFSRAGVSLARDSDALRDFLQPSL
jgi:hypothetical protein